MQVRYYSAKIAVHKIPIQSRRKTARSPPLGNHISFMAYQARRAEAAVGCQRITVKYEKARSQPYEMVYGKHYFVSESGNLLSQHSTLNFFSPMYSSFYYTLTKMGLDNRTEESSTITYTRQSNNLKSKNSFWKWNDSSSKSKIWKTKNNQNFKVRQDSPEKYLNFISSSQKKSAPNSK